MSGATDRPFVVLHVEDDGPLAANVAALLRTQGYVPLTAADGSAALALLRRATPDVLIMDFNLPGEMDGADVAQEICRTLGHVVPAIFLSGELANAALPWLPGAPLLFLAKPADPEVLLHAVESFAALGRFMLAHARR
jgi:two-component system, chemotaxis family, CheB/CheR fusion protein